MIGILFCLSLILHLLSAVLFYKGRLWPSLILLLIGNFMLRYWFASLDPFLNDWDERYHALVAKNLSHHIWLPTLIDQPLLKCEPTAWWGMAHIWLHKQPLFMWQMALSIKIFGATLFAVRLPSMIMGTLLTLVIFDIGRKCADSYIGFIAALLFAFYEPILEMNSGARGMDHNSMAFIFYTTLSIWSWLRFEENKSFKWAVLIGFFAGAAVLNKWLAGLLVFSAFGFHHLFIAQDFFKKEIILYFFAALIACAFTFVPWQVYTLIQFPMQARYELNYNSRHFTEVIEGFEGETFLYINFLKYHYKMMQAFIFIGVGISLWRWRLNPLSISLLVMCLVVYIFFTLAKTKMNEYVLLVAPLMLIFMAQGINGSVRLLLSRYDYRAATLLITAAICYVLFDYNNVEFIHNDHTGWVGRAREIKIKETEWYMHEKSLLQTNDVIVGCPNFSYSDAMFFTDNPAYWPLSEPEKQVIIKQNKHLVPFDVKL